MNWKAYWNDSALVRETDACRQVGRTFHRRSYSSEQVKAIVDRAIEFLQPDAEKTLLDLACGNGMLTWRLAEHFRRVTAIDFSALLIDSARRQFHRDNIDYVVGDALDLGRLPDQYDCILVHFAFQYFSPSQAERLFAGFDRVLKPGGSVLLADVADGDRIWNFYRGVRGRGRFYYDLLRDKPIIGHWWKSADLAALARRHDLSTAISYQGTEMPNHYFRYDAVLRRI
jgi:ubiquinone/menaquinone biosynthesis C-methylase UbiE